MAPHRPPVHSNLQALKERLSELKKLCRSLFFRVEERRKWPDRLAALESLLNHSSIFLKYEQPQLICGDRGGWSGAVGPSLHTQVVCCNLPCMWCLPRGQACVLSGSCSPDINTREMRGERQENGAGGTGHESIGCTPLQWRSGALSAVQLCKFHETGSGCREVIYFSCNCCLLSRWNWYTGQQLLYRSQQHQPASCRVGLYSAAGCEGINTVLAHFSGELG